MPSSRDPVINRQKAREWKLKNPERNRRNNREWMRKRRTQMRPEEAAAERVRWKSRDPIRHLLAIAKKRASQFGIPFDLEPEDLEMPGFCPVLGTPFEWGVGVKGWRNMRAPSLDRIKPQLGYVKGNVRVISTRANHVKGNATINEMEAVLAYMKREGCNSDWEEQPLAELQRPVSPQLALL